MLVDSVMPSSPHHQNSSRVSFKPRNMWIERYPCPYVPGAIQAPGGGAGLIRESLRLGIWN